MERLLKRGAEADIVLGSWGPIPAIYKIRRRKPYMIDSVDNRLRRFRTLREATMLHRSKGASVNTPYIYYVGVKSFTIVMSYIEGPSMKDVIADEPAVGGELGRNLAKLHKNDIIHGDPNTANFLFFGGKWFIVDFGLSVFSNKVEDRAVDFHIVKETLAAQHHAVSELALKSFINGYGEIAGENELKKIIKKLSEIEKRGRYARSV